VINGRERLNPVSNSSLVAISYGALTQLRILDIQIFISWEPDVELAKPTHYQTDKQKQLKSYERAGTPRHSSHLGGSITGRQLSQEIIGSYRDDRCAKHNETSPCPPTV
jgi:hypothetical protein